MTASSWIKIAIEGNAEHTVLGVGGVIDLATASALQGAIDGLIGRHQSALTIDLSDVTFMSSVGLSILASTQERLGGTASFSVVARGLATSRPIQLTGLDEIFRLCSTREEALTPVGHW